MDFSSSLDYLYGLQLFGIKLGLENMQALKARLPLLQKSLSCVHVAGTNGKGSVSVILTEILKHSGLKVGLYTSPHLHCFTERIRIDGEPISQEEMTELAADIKGAADDIPVTFFEATTAMALLAFQKHKVDIAVVETGLGGRLDATNIVDPELCLITPVSYDHSEYLGDTLEKIASEKAGIIKPGVPVVIGRQSAEAEGVLLQSVEKCQAHVSLAGRDYRWSVDNNELTVSFGEERITGLSCALHGEHQLENLAQAAVAAKTLAKRGWKISEQAIRDAGRTVRWPGRLEWLAEGKVLFDVAHNLAGINCLASYLKEQEISGVHLVVGMSGQRAPGKVLKPLEKYVAAVYAVPVLFDLVVPTSEIASWATLAGRECREYESAIEGLKDAMQAVRPGQTIVVCGSLYLVAELRKQLL